MSQGSQISNRISSNAHVSVLPPLRSAHRPFNWFSDWIWKSRRHFSRSIDFTAIREPSTGERNYSLLSQFYSISFEWDWRHDSIVYKINEWVSRYCASARSDTQISFFFIDFMSVTNSFSYWTDAAAYKMHPDIKWRLLPSYSHAIKWNIAPVCRPLATANGFERIVFVSPAPVRRTDKSPDRLSFH